MFAFLHSMNRKCGSDGKQTSVVNEKQSSNDDLSMTLCGFNEFCYGSAINETQTGQFSQFWPFLVPFSDLIDLSVFFGILQSHFWSVMFRSRHQRFACRFFFRWDEERIATLYFCQIHCINFYSSNRPLVVETSWSNSHGLSISSITFTIKTNSR